MAVDRFIELMLQVDFRRLDRGRWQYVTMLHQINRIVAPHAVESTLHHIVNVWLVVVMRLWLLLLLAIRLIRWTLYKQIKKYK